ncbi:MAG: hypothetical protein IH940_05135 [Acidobacteria bacterium]|nr:hypothetical protein [Acidobacteriota bacterium]
MILVAVALIAGAAGVVLTSGNSEDDTGSSPGGSRELGPTEPKSRRRYWVLIGVLAVFGALTGFSIGIPFLFLGVLLAVLDPFRGRRLPFWTALGAYAALVIGFVLLAPWGCSSSTNGGVSSPTTCHSLIGLDYSGGPNYNPSLVPALIVGLTAAASVAASVTLVAHVKRR